MCGVLSKHKILSFLINISMSKFNIVVMMLVLFGGFKPSIQAQNRIVISKDKFLLFVVNSKSDTLFSAPIGVGSNYGNKQKKGDRKTPEGTFKIVKIQDSSKWTHDFKDGYGLRKGAYGPYFFRLKTPRFSGIGIHGTCFPEQIGTRCSEGCIRMNNSDVVKLKKFAFVGMQCVIEKDL